RERRIVSPGDELIEGFRPHGQASVADEGHWRLERPEADCHHAGPGVEIGNACLDVGSVLTDRRYRGYPVRKPGRQIQHPPLNPPEDSARRRSPPPRPWTATSPPSGRAAGSAHPPPPSPRTEPARAVADR